MNTFFNYLYNAFQNGLPYLVSLAGGGSGQPSDIFAFADVTMAYLTSTGVWVRILVFMLMYPIGWCLWTMITYAATSYAIVIIDFQFLIIIYFKSFLFNSNKFK